MKALVINTTRMGDLIQSTPLMQGLQADGYEVTLLYSDGFSEIAKLLAGVDRLVPFSLVDAVNPLILPGNRFIESYRYLSKALEGLTEQSFDLVVNVTHSAYSAMMTGIIAGKKTSGLTCDNRSRRLNQSEWGRYYITSQSCRESNRFNLVDIHRMMGGNTKAFPVKLNIPDGVLKIAGELLAEDTSTDRNVYPPRPGGSVKLIGIVPGASTPEKTLPTSSFAEAIKYLRQTIPVKVVLFGAKSEANIAEELSHLLPDSLNLCGKTDVATLAALISRCDLLLSCDTGPMHIAAAVGTKVVEISLGSALASETAPYGDGHYVIEGRIGCHPCLPRMHCNHFSCGKIIPPEIIAQVAEAALKPERLGADALWQSEVLPRTDTEIRPPENNTRLRTDTEIRPPTANVNIYRTDFDADGFLQLTPLLTDTEIRPPETAEILFQAMKEVWKKALGFTFSTDRNVYTPGSMTDRNVYPPGSMTDRNVYPPGTMTDRNVYPPASMVEQFKSQFIPRQVVLRLDLLRESFSRIEEIARIGALSCEELVRLADDPYQTETLKKLADAIQNIDRGIAQIAYVIPETMPFAAQFTSAKENIRSATLSDHAEKTARLFRGLENWCRSLNQLILDITVDKERVDAA